MLTELMLSELGYCSEAEATAMTGLTAARLRVAGLKRAPADRPLDAHGRPIKNAPGIPIGSRFCGEQFIYPRANISEFIAPGMGGR